MKNKTILAIAFFAISLLIIPQMTFASWWKPNTWKIFNKKSEVKIEQKIIATSTPNNAISQTEKATTTEKIEQKSEEARKPKAASSFADTSTRKNDQSKEIEKLKKELEVLKQKQSQFKIIEKITEKQIIAEKKQSSSSQTKQNENIVTLPNGAVVEMDANGNISRTIKEAVNVAPLSTFKHVIVSAPQYVSKEIKNGEKDVQLMSLLLQSAGDTPVRVEEASIRIIGPANTIKMIKISNCGPPQSLNNNGESVLSCPLLIKNGSSNRYNIVADIADNISSENGKTIQVSVESIKANDAVISGEFPIVSAPHKIVSSPLIEEKIKKEEISKQQNSSTLSTSSASSQQNSSVSFIPSNIQTLTYEQLHCPRFYKLQDSLGNTREVVQNIEDRTGIPGIGGSFVKGKVSDITLKVFAYDPDGDTLQYRLAVFADGFQSPSRYAWSANNEFSINVLNNIGLGPHKWIYIDVSDRDSFNCAATNIDSNAYFDYTVYPE